MINLSRRKFVIGATALVCAPAIIRVAKIMPIKAAPYPTMQDWLNLSVPRIYPNSGITALDFITHKAVLRALLDTNTFIASINARYDDAFAIGAPS